MDCMCKTVLVNFEIAKLLKEKGFNEYSNYGYGIAIRHNGRDISFDEECELKNLGRENEIEYVDGGQLYQIWCNNEEEMGGLYACPTQYTVMRWLREVHKIHISPMPYYCEDGQMWLSNIYLIEQYQLTDLKLISMVNETYEEAVEKAIVKALNYIK